MNFTIIDKKLLICNGESEITYSEINKATSRYDINEIVLPNSIQVIQDNAFFDCSEINRINIPTSVQYIGTQAFWGMDELEELMITKNIRYIGKHAFCNCRKLVLKISNNGKDLSSGWDPAFYANINSVVFEG